MIKFSDIKNWYCSECGKPLDKNKIIWLELNQETGYYYKPGEVDEQESQGEFPFGSNCAKKALRGETVNC